MIVRSLELSEYRNYSVLKAEFHPGTNLIFGDNAQGKTNALEAIYECATSRSHRGSKDREIIRFGAEEAHIRLVTEKRGIPSKVDIHLRKNKPKGIAVNGIPIKKVSELFGILNVVMFSPEDLRIVKSSPQERRRFIDVELCQLNKLYISELINYNKALLQRNDLLKQGIRNKEQTDLLDVWDVQLAEYGKAVMAEREKFIAELDEIIVPIHQELTGNKETIRLEYLPSVSREQFDEKLFLGRDTDVHTGTTNIGPHRDDLAFMINGLDVRKYGSQGQQRTAALSLKLAEIELVKKMINDSPVLLLDDVLSELDESRQERLLGSISKVQTFMTCTGLEDLAMKGMKVDRKFRVTEGIFAEETV